MDVASRGAAQRGRLLGSVLKLLISLGLIGLVLVFVDFGQLLAHLVKLNPWPLAAAGSLVYLDRVLMAYKWNRLLVALNVQIPFLVVVRTYLVTPVVQMVLPSTIGADAFRLYILSRHKVDSRAVFVSIIIERVIGFFAILSLVLFGIVLAFYLMADRVADILAIGWIFIAAAIAGVGLVVTLLSLLVLLARALGTRLGSHRIWAQIRTLLDLQRENRLLRRTIAYFFVWTFVEQLLPIAIAYTIVQALHIDVSLLDLLIVIPFTTLAIRLPISVDGFGVQEGLFVALFGLLGISPAEALLLSSLKRVVALICALPWAAYYLYGGFGVTVVQQEVSPMKLR